MSSGPISPSRRRTLVAKGMRVLELALRRLNQLPHQIESAEDDLTLVGFVGLRDPCVPKLPRRLAMPERQGSA